jgi:FtsP/CotA-like multicopper oxidase with cupredoxin domain
MPSRREFLAAAAASLTAIALPPRFAAAAGYQLTPRPASWPVLGAPQPQTSVWAYNGLLPGPLLRVDQGERLTAKVTNNLPDNHPTTVHWHGIRLPNAMDGVPGLTQEPIRPGESFTYDFTCPDAGTFWYHPHLGSPEQLGRGLYGALIVDEPAPPMVDRDVLWVLDDMRLAPDAQIAGDFRNAMDLSHAGRLGNTFLLNGKLAESFPLRAGERIRLRLLNTANARVFNPHFEGHRPWLIAWDGHPLQPLLLDEGATIQLGPGMRADLILDAVGMPGARYRVLDSDLRGSTYRLLDLDYGPAATLRREALPPPLALTPNPVSVPDLAAAERLNLVLNGGAMGATAALEVDGHAMSLRDAFQKHRVAWGLNGQAMTDHHDHRHHMLFELKLGRSYRIAIDNQTAWPHPIHLHGHAFRVLSRNGRAEPQTPFADTVLLQGRETAEIAFVADNPGDWMLHCHIQEHQAAGMMAMVRVS